MPTKVARPTKVERSTECRADNRSVDDLIEELVRTTNPREVEVLSDRLGLSHDPRAIRPLLVRLGDCHVQEDADIEDAVCRALMVLNVMRSCGNRSFSLRPRRELPDDVVDVIHELAGAIPWRYFGTARS